MNHEMRMLHDRFEAAALGCPSTAALFNMADTAE
jgi:hypothetical protein